MASCFNWMSWSYAQVHIINHIINHVICHVICHMSLIDMSSYDVIKLLSYLLPVEQVALSSLCGGLGSYIRKLGVFMEGGVDRVETLPPYPNLLLPPSLFSPPRLLLPLSLLFPSKSSFRLSSVSIPASFTLLFYIFLLPDLLHISQIYLYLFHFPLSIFLLPNLFHISQIYIYLFPFRLFDFAWRISVFWVWVCKFETL